MRQILHSLPVILLLFAICLGDSIPENGDQDLSGSDPQPPDIEGEFPQFPDTDGQGHQSGRGMFSKGKQYLSGLLGVGAGTVFSALNAVGQEINNVAGNDNLIGQIGSTVSMIAEHGTGTIKFNLFTPKNPKEGYRLTTANVANSKWDKTQDTIAIIHGFTPIGYFAKPEDNIISSLRIKDGFLQNAKLQANIIVVDWTGLSSDGVYLFSSTSTSTTADRLSTLLVWLTQNGYIAGPKNIRVVGHSLGGHTAGITGKKYFEKYKLGKIRRVDAIDPAGPNFDMIPSNFQLKPENADFVHALHCNIGFLGSKQNRGTIDFYPNGGDNLPGCENAAPLNSTEANTTTTSRKKRNSVATHICNHVRCNDLYIELLEDEKYGCPCQNWEDFVGDKCDCKVEDPKSDPRFVRMGYHCPETASGVYYLNITMRTELKPPTADELEAAAKLAAATPHAAPAAKEGDITETPPVASPDGAVTEAPTVPSPEGAVAETPAPDKPTDA